MPTKIRSYPGVLVSPPQPCTNCAIRSRTLFANLPDESLEWAQQYRAYQSRVPAKRKIFIEGQTASHTYTLFDGFVAIYKTLPNGKRQILRFALPGDFLGFQSQLDSPMHYSAESLSPVVLCAFPRNRLKQLLKTHNELAYDMCIRGARESELCHYHLTLTGRLGARERIAFLLLELYYRCRDRGLVANEGAFPSPFRRRTLPMQSA